MWTVTEKTSEYNVCDLYDNRENTVLTSFSLKMYYQYLFNNIKLIQFSLF